MSPYLWTIQSWKLWEIKIIFYYKVSIFLSVTFGGFPKLSCSVILMGRESPDNDLFCLKHFSLFLNYFWLFNLLCTKKYIKYRTPIKYFPTSNARTQPLIKHSYSHSGSGFRICSIGNFWITKLRNLVCLIFLSCRIFQTFSNCGGH